MRCAARSGPPVRSRTWRRHPYGIAFSPDGARLALGYDDTSTVDLLDARTLAPLPRPDLDGIDSGNLAQCAWSRDGATLFAAGRYAPVDRSPVLAWAGGGVGARRSLPAGQHTVMSLCRCPTATCWSQPAIPGSAGWRRTARRAGGTATGGRFPPQFDRLPSRTTAPISASASGPSANRPRASTSATRTLTPGSATDAGMAAPRQTGLPIEHWQDQYHPTLGGRPLALEPYERSRSLAIHPDGDRFVLGADWSLRAFDAHGTPLWTRAAPGVVWAVNITGDGRLVVAAYGDGTIRWHRMRDGVELLAFMPLANQTNWVAWTPEGFYAATPGAHGVLRWHVNHGWDAPADSVPIDDIPGSYRPAVLPLVLQELETPRALGLAVLAEHNKEVTMRTHSHLPPGVQLHLLTIGISAYNAGLREEPAPALRRPRRPRSGERDRQHAGAALSRSMRGAAEPGRQPRRHPARPADAAHRRWNAAAATISRWCTSRATARWSMARCICCRMTPMRAMRPGSRRPLCDRHAADRTAELAEHGRVLVLLDACHSGATTLDGERWRWTRRRCARPRRGERHRADIVGRQRGSSETNGGTARSPGRCSTRWTIRGRSRPYRPDQLVHWRSTDQHVPDLTDRSRRRGWRCGSTPRCSRVGL